MTREMVDRWMIRWMTWGLDGADGEDGDERWGPKDDGLERLSPFLGLVGDRRRYWRMQE
jgi:hypothetical protein